MDNAASTQESRRLAYRAARPPLKLHSPRSLPFSPAPCTPRLAEVAALDGHATLSTMAQPSEPYPRRPGPPERVAAERAARAPGLSSRAWYTALRLLHALLARRPRPALRHTAHVLQARLSGPVNDAAHMNALLLRALAEVVVMGLLWACAVQRGRSYRVPHSAPSIT